MSSSSAAVIFESILEITDWRPRPHELVPPPVVTPAPQSRSTLPALGRDLDDKIPF